MTYAAPSTKSLKSTNRTGFTGISIHPQSRKFRADICLSGKKTYLGLYPTVGAAAEARARVLQQEVKSLEVDNEQLSADFDAVNQELLLLLKQLQQFQTLLDQPSVAQLLHHERNKQRTLQALREAA
jgi:hypothetical protein